MTGLNEGLRAFTIDPAGMHAVLSELPIQACQLDVGRDGGVRTPEGVGDQVPVYNALIH